MRTQSIRLALAIVLLCPFAPAQWMKTNGPYGGNVLCFAVSGTNIFAGTGWNGIYLSTNNGTSWTSVNSGLPQYTGVNALLVSGTNLFAGTDSGLFVSTDNGTGWTMDSASLSHIPVTALAMSGTNLFAGTLQGVFVSTDNGISWIQSYNTPSSNVTRFAVTASSVFVTDSGFVFRSTNGGSSWTSVSKGLPQYVRSVSGLYAAFSQVYVVVSYEYCDGCSGTAVCRSTDNGENWTTCGIPIYDILLQHDANLLAATSNGVLLSTDQGTSWAVVSNGLPQSSIVNALAVSGTNIFAAIPVSGVFLSTNNGTSWAAVNNGLTTTIGVGALAFSGTNLFAGTDGGGVHLSTDNGRSWTAKTGLTNIFVTALAVSGTNLFAGTDGGVFTALESALPVEFSSMSVEIMASGVNLKWRTETEISNYAFEIERRTVADLSVPWKSIGFIRGSGTSSSPHEYSFVDHDLSPGRYAYRIKQINNDGTFTYHGNLEIEILAPSTFALKQNYPNPFNPATTICFSLPSRSFVSLKVFDALGREVSILLADELPAGTYTQQWNAAKMSSGIYFYRLQAGSFTETKKLVLLR
jgi:photosystem II stability/assembly factor-like uncharacterized protein